MSGAELSTPQLERYRAHLRRLLVERFDNNQAKLAKAIGISGPSLSMQLSKKSGPKWTTVRALARLLAMSADEVIGPETVGGALPMTRRTIEPGDTYPARHAVLARESHLFNPTVLEYAMQRRFTGVEGWPERQWLRWLLNEQDMLESEGEAEYRASRLERTISHGEREKLVQAEATSGRRQGVRLPPRPKRDGV